MITLSSTAELLAALQHARNVTLTAYTLEPGSVLDGLTRAARSGAHVTVRLEGYIYKDDGTVGAANAAAVEQLRSAGADAQLVHPAKDSRDAMLHAKTAVVDGTLFLDDRNWPDDGGDTIVRDDFARDAEIALDASNGRADPPTTFYSIAKRESLASEARLIDEARSGDDVILESESFGASNRVFTALEAAVERGARVRVLVNRRDLQGNANEAAAIAALRADGADVRACDGDEKFAIVDGMRGWIGSTNVTAAFDRPDQLDWGMRTDAPSVVAHERDAFETRWRSAIPSSG